MTSWRELREQTEVKLRAVSPHADSEARWMIERVSGYDGVELVMGESEPAPAAADAHVDDMVARRALGEPLQYVLGEWQFLGLDLLVDRRVLVPRPETEVVARVAIEEATRLGARHGPPEPWTAVDESFPAVDLGTGSGALALALVSELPEVLVWATDASDDALKVARANLAGTGVAATRVRLASGSWFGALPEHLRGRVRVIVANPPYIAEHEVPALPPEVIEWEPYGALVSGPTGMEAIAVIVDGAPEWLAPHGGALVVELAPHQAAAVSERAHAAGFNDVVVRPDLTGRDRVPSHASLASVRAMADELDVDAMIVRFRERAAAVKDRPLPPVAGADRQRFIDQAQRDFQDFAIIGDATWEFADGTLTLRVDLTGG